MIALRIIVFYPLMLYKYVYVLVNRYRRYKTNPVRMGLIWYGIGEKVLFFLLRPHVWSNIVTNCVRTFLRTGAIDLSFLIFRMYMILHACERSILIPPERIRKEIILYPNSKFEYRRTNWLKTDNRTDSNFILDKIQLYYDDALRVKGFGTEIRHRWRGRGKWRLSKVVRVDFCPFFPFFFFFFHETTSKLYAANNNNTGSLRKSNVLAEGYCYMLLYARCCLLSLPPAYIHSVRNLNALILFD